MTDDSVTSTRSVPWSSPRFQVIIANSLIGVMGVSLLSPVLPTLRSVFAVSDAQIGLMITVFTVPGIVITPFVGLAADKFGRRRTLIPLLLLFGVAGSLIAVVETYRHVLILRFVQGIGGSALVTISLTLAGDYYEGRRQKAVIGLNSSALGLGAAIFPLIGGVLAGVRWELPFVFFASSILVGVLAIPLIDESATGETISSRRHLKHIWTAAVQPKAFKIYLAAFATFFLYYGAVLTAVPLLLSGAYGTREPYLGIIIAVVSISNALVAARYGRLQQLVSMNSLIVAGFVLNGLALIAVRIVTAPLHVALVLVVYGAGFGLIMPSLNSAIVTVADADQRASMLGVNTSLLRVGQTLGPLAIPGLAGVLYPTPLLGYRVVLPGFGILAVLFGIGFGAHTIVRRA
ncbi:MAG: MFS transporter [Halodesulfurarchaeum sp.]